MAFAMVPSMPSPFESIKSSSGRSTTLADASSNRKNEAWFVGDNRTKYAPLFDDGGVVTLVQRLDSAGAVCCRTALVELVAAQEINTEFPCRVMLRAGCAAASMRITPNAPVTNAN